MAGSGKFFLQPLILVHFALAFTYTSFCTVRYSIFNHKIKTEFDLNVEFQVGIIRRSCILLLEQLSTVALEINAQVRDEAIKVAGQWKKKMREAVGNSLEVLGFLHLLAAYTLAPAFDDKELESLLLLVAQHRQTPKLRQSLGLADTVIGKLFVIGYLNLSGDICALHYIKKLILYVVRFLFSFYWICYIVR